MAYKFKEHFTINTLNIYGNGGEFHSKEIREGFWNFDKAIADIQISMAGTIAERIVCKTGSIGCESDLQRAREVDLLSYLRVSDPGQLVRFSRNTYCTREHDSLKISNGKTEIL